MSSDKIRFGDIELDPAKRQITRAGEALRLPPKAFDCLAYLVVNRARAVGRDELIAAVWGRTEIDDNLLDQAITRVRRAIGDNDESRRMLRTVPRFGYAWAAPTQVVDEAPSVPTDADTATVPPAEPAATPRAAPQRLWLRSVGALAIAALVLMLLYATTFAPLGQQYPVRPVNHDSNIGLVLPFAFAADDSHAWARLGVMDLVAERLRAAGQPIVPSDNVVALARGLDARAPDATQVVALADAAGAGLVIAASGEIVGGYWRVTLRAVHGRLDPAPHAEAESQELMDAARAAADRFALQLGLAPPAHDDLGGPRERALAGVLAQAEAALLADRVPASRALLESLEPDQRALPEVRFRLARLDFREGRYDDAEKAYESLLNATSSDEPVFRARLLNSLGNIALRRDDYVLSASRSDAAIVLLGESQPSIELGRAYTGRAIARSSASQYDAALPDFARARAVLESVGDRLGLARVDANLGILDGRRDRYAEAVPVLERAAGGLANFHDLSSELYVRVALAGSRLALLQPVAALADEKRLGELVAREPSPPLARYANFMRSEVLAANGRLADAERLYETTLADAKAAKDDALVASLDVVGARRALAQGRPADAARVAAAVAASSWNAESVREHASLWLTLVRAQAATGDAAAAAQTAQAAQAWARRHDAAAAQVYASLIAAESSAVAQEKHSARAAYEDALAHAEAARVPEDVLTVSSVYTDWLIGQGDLARATTVAARTAGWADTSYDAALLQVRLYAALDERTPWHGAIARADRLAGERRLPEALVPPDLTPHASLVRP
jgi:DNA-binding winged helix-turn-helix (wHTH) protein/tetratricopeptide (TPR) repeat protein